MIRLLAVMAFAGLIVAAVIDAAGPADDLSKGIQQVKEGNFDAGLLTLDGEVTRLAASSDPKDVHDRAQAHLYLGVAYVGLLQETPARKHFREALKLDPELKVDPQQFPARVVRVFEAAKTNRNKPALYAGAGVVGVGALIGGAAVLFGGAAAVSIGAVVLPSDTTTTTTTTTTPPTPIPPLFLEGRGASNAVSFRQSVAGTVTASASAPGSTLGLSLCRGEAVSTRDCNTVASGNDSISGTLPAGTNTLIVQALRLPPGQDSIVVLVSIRLP